MEHLPLKCICGYQSKIDRLEQETEVLREQLRQLGDERTEAADEIERLRAEVARLTLVSSLWESEFVAAVDEIKRLGKS